MKKEETKNLSPTCQLREKLVGYLYNDLSQDEARSFEEHLKDCPHCRQDLEDFRLVREALRSWQVEEAPHIVWHVKQPFWPMVRQLLVAAPIYARLAFGAAVVMLLLAIFNVRIEWSRSSGFRFQASLLPQRTVERLDQVAPQSVDSQTLSKMIDERVRQAEESWRVEMAAKLDEHARQLVSQQNRMLMEFLQDWQSEQKRQWAVWLRELESRRYGALTFADIFFSEKNGN